MIDRTARFLGIALILLSGSVLASRTALFWETNFSQALGARDAYYKKMGVTRLPIDWAEIGGGLRTELAASPDEFSPWYHFLTGVSLVGLGLEDSSSHHFSEALSLCSNSPGVSWVLFRCFLSEHLYLWAGRCLSQLHGLFIASGALAAPLVSQQLVSYARTAPIEVAGDTLDLLHWASRFERDPFWPHVAQALASLPMNPGRALGATTAAIQAIRSSWALQAKLAYVAYQWLRSAITVFVIAVVMVAMVSGAPRALHGIGHVFPKAVPASFRIAFSVALLLSLVAFGMVPFLIVAGIVLWPCLERPIRPLLAAAMIALAAAPLDARISDFFISILSNDSTVGLYKRSLETGVSREFGYLLEASARDKRLKGDFLVPLACATHSWKSGDIPDAVARVAQAEKLAGEDPVVLVTSGNIAMGAGNTRRARTSYTRAAELFPQYEEANFNLGQYYLASMQTVKGTDLIEKATSKAPDRVNGFVADNTAHFADSWPTVRQTMQPRYRPSDFWRRVAGSHGGSWQSAELLWTPRFLGLPPLIALIVVPIFILAMTFVHSRRAGGKALQSVFTCRQCGAVMCRRCRAGTICSDCQNYAKNAESERIAKDIANRIRTRSDAYLCLRVFILDVLYPGAGSLLRATGAGIPAVVLMMVTALVYATYVALATVVLASPMLHLSAAMMVILAMCVVYSIVNTVRSTIVFVGNPLSRELGSVT